MPIVEAMASGCPVVTSEVSSMPEVAGAATELIDPRSVKSLITGIQQGRASREELASSGLNRAKQFSWDNAAKSTADILQLVR